MIQCIGRAGRNTRDVHAHFAWACPCSEIRRSGNHIVTSQLSQLENIVRTIPNTHATTDTRTQKLLFRQGARRTNSHGGQRRGLSGIDSQPHTHQANTTSRFQHVTDKLPAVYTLNFRLYWTIHLNCCSIDSVFDIFHFRPPARPTPDRWLPIMP